VCASLLHDNEMVYTDMHLNKQISDTDVATVTATLLYEQYILASPVNKYS